ncbi:MAG: WD40 repeat domain-containing protein, partial [Chloroflexota bacterium]
LTLPGPTPRTFGIWAPDGTRFVYFIGEEMYLCTVEPPACQLTALSDNPVAHWSPDSRLVVFSPGADRIQVFNGRTGETVLRDTLFPETRDSILLRPLWLDNHTILFTHGLDGTPYTLRVDDPTPRIVPTDSPTLAHLIASQHLTMEAVVYHFGNMEPDVLQIQQFSPIGNTVPPNVMLDEQNNGFYAGALRW